MLQSQLFLLAGVGFSLCKKRIIDESFQKYLTNIMINVILPCNIVVSFEMEISSELLIKELEILCLSVVVQIICICLNRVLYISAEPEKKKVLKYGTLCSNAGFLGTSIVDGMFGSEGLILTSIFLIPQRIAIWTAGVSIFSESEEKLPWKKLLSHPCIVAVEIGLLIMILQIKIPEFVEVPMKKLGNCTLPLSMILIGMIISRANLKSFFDKTVLYFCFIRLILIPGLTLLIGSLVNFDNFSVLIGTILTAMPMGATVTILAAKYGGCTEFSVSCLAASSLFSIFLTPLWFILL